MMTNTIKANKGYTKIRRDANRFARRNEAETVAIVATAGGLAVIGAGTIVAGAVKGVRRGIGAIKHKLDDRKLNKLEKDFNNAIDAADAALNGEEAAPATEEQNNNGETAEETKPGEGTKAANEKEEK